MINGLNNLATGEATQISSSAKSKVISAEPIEGKSFADVLKDSIGEVSRLQEDASNAIKDLSAGKNENVTGIMTAVQKSDLAFKTLLAIRSKLMDAYEEIKNISI